jgi:putative transposase
LAQKRNAKLTQARTMAARFCLSLLWAPRPIFVERLWRTVKYEDVYLQKYANMPDLLLGLTDYFQFYNEERLYQSLGHATPNTVYQTAQGGGAKIVDRFSGTQKVSSTSEE